MTDGRPPAILGDWWRPGAIYQIYPRSFQDSGGDGIGDLEGIRRRLDYLVGLGVDAIWISPFYPSPMHDFGYDVSNYCDVDPIFGSLRDFDLLLADAHRSGLKIVLDFVPNHTSIEHEWFAASRQRRDDKSDWYIWRDGAPSGGPPNNWRSHFGGPAWSFDSARGQYYYHAFLPQQPDLNWRNPKVKAAMFDVLRFWLRRGVDGFRVDVISQLMKDEALRDNPANPGWTPLRPQIEELLQLYSGDQDDIHPLIAEMRGVLAEFGDPLLIGEIYLPMERLVAYYGAALSGAHLPFNFQLLETPWQAESLGAMIASYEALLPEGAWPNWVLSNHDRPRVATRVGDAQARVATMLLLTLRGTPTLYYGDELGIGHVDISPPRIRDPWALREPSLAVGRDPVRTPMQWDDSANAGFSTHEPWLPLTPDWPERNVERFEAEPASLLHLTRRLLHYRRDHRTLSLGSWRLLASSNELLAYERRSGQETTIVVLNLGGASQLWRLDPAGSSFCVAISTYCDRAGERVDQVLRLRPDEGVVLAVLG
ncbi:alpha amylase catalytic region [Methylocella silvestris BL2]|uniref:Alpha amylase catalytic region n=1 Tax=Methylocella silvestris (strain DSM 15510 / CIP 108128 / LMG 27833 / NCIMB 13906 / BL2) TaxID=395965 RepID=B8ENW9_METSB|nr:alpha-amylase family glycosyl hydrolase [Methylocella silvestris]ACK49207.1 alpha amylase catalytic region [Methylocella silvestris BL2]